MPANPKHHAIARQWELLKLLPTRGGATAGDLAQSLAGCGFDVSKRTVERDLEQLEALFPITHGEDTPYGWRWLDGARMNVTGLSTPEALTLQLVEEHVRPMLPPAVLQQVEPLFGMARRKLDSESGSNNVARWRHKVASLGARVQIPPAVDSEVLQAVQLAVLGEYQVEVDRTLWTGNIARAKIMSPLGLLLRMGVPYLVAHDGKRVGQFPLHRMSAVRALHTLVKLPKGFDLEQFVQNGDAEFGTNEEISLRAWVSPKLALNLADAKLAADQTITPCEDREGSIVQASTRLSWSLE